MEVAAIVPVPDTVEGNKAAAFTPLAGESPLVRVVKAALGAGTPVVVAAVETLVEQCRKSLGDHGVSSVDVISAGEGSRAHCLIAALEKSAPDVVLVHDIHRPLTSPALQERVMTALRAGSPVVMPALPLTDSVKAIDANGSVTATIDRSTLQTVQYPRGFTTGQLSELLACRSSDYFDELEESLAAGVSITVVEGDPDAFVVELPRDAALVEAIIASRQ
jgi:2-C-methyl-D-erythritol 4-phosphate cytidylyltransferase